MDTIMNGIKMLMGLANWQSILIFGSIFLIALPIVGFIIWRVFKNWKQDKAVKDGEDQAVKDIQNKIVGNDAQGKQIATDEQQAKVDKDAALNKITGGST